MKNAGSIDDFSDRFLLAVGHDVHAADAAHLAYRLHQLDADIAPLAGLIPSAAEARDDGVGDMHARNIFAHPFRRFRGTQRTVETIPSHSN